MESTGLHYSGYYHIITGAFTILLLFVPGFPQLFCKLFALALELQVKQRNFRKWKNLSIDCLANIFGRLELESRLLDIPLVCKPWRKAALDPLCWQKLEFPKNLYNSRLATRRLDVDGLIEFVVNRSQRCATLLILPNNCTKKGLEYISDECPLLKSLVLLVVVVHAYRDIIPILICKWKSLEMLCLESGHYNLEKIIAQVSIHCKNFVNLSIPKAYIEEEEVYEIVSSLPNIKYMTLSGSNISRENLAILLQGCKKLVHLDVRNCRGFEEDDDMILKMASPINNFQCEGSHYVESSDDDMC